MNRFLLLLLLIPLSGFSQLNKDYQGLLWKISGNGLEEPSYLYGTMHVSNRVAFHLSESFFNALDNADIVALETNPESWVEEMTTSQIYEDYFTNSYGSGGGRYPLYEAFYMKEPQLQDWQYYLSRDQEWLNFLLYRLDDYDQDFAENTFLDMFIYQVGKKGNKSIVSLEDYAESLQQVLKAQRHDKDAVYVTERQARDVLGDFTSWQALMEDAYRRGDLDLIDTINTVLYPGKFYRPFMLDVRNERMVNGMDSLMHVGSVFTGVGAAHLPGENGVINLLRKMGYTVEAEERDVTSNSIKRKEEIDTAIYTTELVDFTSDDGFIQTTVPGKLTKLIGQPFQEFVFADMANGAFYSLRRIPTFSQINGRSQDYAFGHIDSMLFENIPGKIHQKDTIEVSGFPALDIRNETRSGDLQHYQIVFTPLEVLIFKVGGHKTFAESELPEKFFSSIRLNTTPETITYSPQFGAFKVDLPGNVRNEQYHGFFEDSHQTFWAQSHDGPDYFAAGMRQYYDFDYIEEDAFELKYFVEKIVQEEEYEIEELEVVSGSPYDYSKFHIIGKNETDLYGQVHIQGPKYVMLITTSADKKKRDEFFSSFAFQDWNYPDEFTSYQDSVYHVDITSPRDVNNYQSFFQGLARGRSYGSYSDRTFEGVTKSRTLTYEHTGEELEIKLRTLHKFASYENLNQFWNGYKEMIVESDGLVIVSDSVLYTIEEDDYLCQAVNFVLSDTNSERLIYSKMILENGALYTITGMGDSLGYTSQFVQKAIESFKTSDDTVIGLPITTSKADIFFEALESEDSTQVYQANRSVRVVSFEEDDADKIKEIVLEYKHKEFERTARLGLLNRLADLEGEEHIEFLTELYYDQPDSSTYQFSILETLAEIQTVQGNETFNKLILDEPPFSSSTYAYSSMFYSLKDSLELAPMIYPDILTLADFDDYRTTIYSTLATLLDSNLVTGEDYEMKYETLLLFAKVALKKQHASTSGRSYYYGTSSNSQLETYTKLLTPFSDREEVQEHFDKVLSIRNKEILADLLLVIEPYHEIPDSSWNYVAKDNKAYMKIFSYLKDADKLDVLDDEFLEEEVLAKNMLLSDERRQYDTISFIRTEEVEVLSKPAKAYFFRARDDDEKLWKLMYIVVEDGEELTDDFILCDTGETYNESLGEMDEIIEDALDEIKIYRRERASNNYYGGYY